MAWNELLRHFPEELQGAILEEADGLREIRLRAARRVELVGEGTSRLIGSAISSGQLRSIALSLMEYSYYAHEKELSGGFFTMHNGCRVGVCGTFSQPGDKQLMLQSIGSLCIRIARQIPGCAELLVKEMLKSGRPGNMLIASAPGLGKTTLLRDAARLLSARGYAIGIVDERHEIAACRDGVPTMDVGERTDVADGCPKRPGMEMLVRSMSPDIIITDEIGNGEDLQAVREASRRGISVLTSAHAGSFSELAAGPLRAVLQEGVFERIALLKDAPGRIEEIRAMAAAEGED